MAILQKRKRENEDKGSAVVKKKTKPQRHFVNFCGFTNLGDWDKISEDLEESDWESWEVKPVAKAFKQAQKELKKQAIKGKEKAAHSTMLNAELAAHKKFDSLLAEFIKENDEKSKGDDVDNQNLNADGVWELLKEGTPRSLPKCLGDYVVHFRPTALVKVWIESK